MSVDDWLFLAVLSHVFVVVLIVGYVGIVRRESWLSPIVLFIAFLELFTLPLPVRALQTLAVEGDITQQLPQILPFLAPSLWLVTVGLLVFVTCYYLPPLQHYAQLLPNLTTRRDRSPYVVSIALSVFCLILISALARSAGGILAFILLGYGGTAEMFGKGYLAIGFPWLFIAAMMPLVRYAHSGRRRELAVFVGAFSLLTIMNLVMGNRSHVMYEILVAIIFWHLAISKVSLVRVLPVGIAAFVALNLFGHLRGSKYESFGDFLSRSDESFGRVRESSEISKGAVYTLTTGEFVVPFESLPMIMRGESRKSVELQYGRTFINAFSFFIPNALWPNRPRPLGEWYMREFYGEGLRANEGRQFFFLAEGYLNLGAPGVLIIMVVWGVIWGIVGLYVRQRGPILDPMTALCIALSVAFMFRGIAGDLRAMLVGLPEQALVPALLCAAYLTRTVSLDDPLLPLAS